jgi:hypothetical protein
VFERSLTVEKTKYPLILDTVRSFARMREYALDETVEDDRFTFTLVDRKADSALGISARVFFGGYFAPQRIRITVVGATTVERGVAVSVRGDVLMSEWNTVDDRPRRGDARRCERISEDLVERLGSL